MLKNSLLVALFKLGPNGGQLPQVVVMHVKENQDISYTKGGTESGWPSSGSSWKNFFTHIYLYTTTKLSMLFQVLWLWLPTCTLERILFLDFGLAVTEINIKNV